HPRAVHLDDEAHRILARLGIGAAFAAVSRPSRGLRLLDGEMRVLAEFRRATAPGRHGFPESNMFDQPELERLLLHAVARRPEARLRGDAEVTAVVPEGRDSVRVEYTDRRTGEAASVRADYVLGCDGAGSLTRSAVGAAMRDLRFAQRWL